MKQKTKTNREDNYSKILIPFYGTLTAFQKLYKYFTHHISFFATQVTNHHQLISFLSGRDLGLMAESLGGHLQMCFLVPFQSSQLTEVLVALVTQVGLCP